MIYLKHQSDAVPRVDCNRHTWRKVSAVDDPMHILLNLAHRESRVGSGRLQCLQCLHFQVLPLERLPILVPHQHFTDQHPLLVAPTLIRTRIQTRRRWVPLLLLSRWLIGDPIQSQRSRTEKLRLRYQQLSRLVWPSQRQRRGAE